MRILCLHGYLTNRSILRTQLDQLLAHTYKDQIEYEFVNAPMSEDMSKCDPIVLTRFGHLVSTEGIYTWYKLETNESITLNALKAIVQNGRFDGILGFSQGGAAALRFTAWMESGLADIPAEKRCHVVCVLNCPSSRIKESFGRMATTIVMGFGTKDALAKPWDLAMLVNPCKIVMYDEMHCPPKQFKGVDDLAQALKQALTRRWFAFDFDGVLCDSAKETGTTAWMACVSLGERFFPKTAPSNIPDDLLRAFCNARPLLETGFEALLILKRLYVEKESWESMLASREPLEEMKRSLQHCNVTEEELKKAFQQARDSWIARDETGWLAANDFYMETVRAVQTLISRGASVYVVTTKHSSFAVKLLNRVGIDLPMDRIFGLGSGKKRQVLSNLATSREAQLGGRCIFFEDRLETLLDVSRHAQLPCDLVLCGYGYNTQHEREKAVERGFIVKNTASELCEWAVQQYTQ